MLSPVKSLSAKTERMSGGKPPIELSSEVKEVVFICFMGVLCYFVMVCCILMRPPPRKAEGFATDADQETFVARKPEEENAVYFEGSNMETVFAASQGHWGRLMVDVGSTMFRNGRGEEGYLDKRHYGVFKPDEKFELFNKSDDLMYHINLYAGALKAEDGEEEKKDQ